ncbi:uncharacterized protein J3R85_002967 [Psidium guajava]|nr:uncharacterized protein J3R85_002967 [Psidium guajava]
MRVPILSHGWATHLLSALSHQSKQHILSLGVLPFSLRRHTRRMFRTMPRRKSSRVADEAMLGGRDRADLPIFAWEPDGRSARGWRGLPVLFYGVFRATVSIISCFSPPHVNGADGAWVPGHEFGHQASEMNHLVVSDSMRYAILM